MQAIQLSRLSRLNALLVLGTIVVLGLQWRAPLSTPSPTTALWFFGTIAVLTLFDAQLPDGDIVDMSTPLVAAAAVVAGAPATLAAVFVSRGLLLLARRGDGRASRVLDAMIRAVFSVAVAGGLIRWIPWGVAQSASSTPFRFVLGTAIPLLVFFAVSFGSAQMQSSARERRPLAVLVAANVRLQGWLVAAQISIAVLSVLVATQMGPWGLAIVVLLQLVVTQSFTLLVEVRTAYRDTVSLLARAMEAENPERLAHAERVTRLATSIGREVGLQGQRLEWLTYAAMFHDMDLLGTDELGQTQQMRLEPEIDSPGGAVVGEVKFLEPIAKILGIVNASGDTDTSHDEFDIMAAYIVARASEIDDAMHDRADNERRSEGVGRRLYADRRRDLDSRIGRSTSRLSHSTAPARVGRTR